MLTTADLLNMPMDEASIAQRKRDHRHAAKAQPARTLASIRRSAAMLAECLRAYRATHPADCSCESCRFQDDTSFEGDRADALDHMLTAAVVLEHLAAAVANVEPIV